MGLEQSRQIGVDAIGERGCRRGCFIARPSSQSIGGRYDVYARHRPQDGNLRNARQLPPRGHAFPNPLHGRTRVLEADDASADYGAGTSPEARDERLLQLLCRSHEQPGDQLIPLSCHMALASRASAAEPEWPDAMGANEALDRSLAAARAPATSTP